MRSHIFRGCFQGSENPHLPLMCGSLGISHNAQILKHLESLGTKQGSNPCSGTTFNISILWGLIYFHKF